MLIGHRHPRTSLPKLLDSVIIFRISCDIKVKYSLSRKVACRTRRRRRQSDGSASVPSFCCAADAGRFGPAQVIASVRGNGI